MPSPFPGMDPYLEDPEIWQDFHADLAVGIKHYLNPQIGPKYFAVVETQSTPYSLDVQLANPMRPDVSIYEAPVGMLEPPGRGEAAMAIPAAPLLIPAVATRQRSVRVYRTRTKDLVTTIEILSPFNKRPASDGLLQYRFKRTQVLESQTHLVELDLLRAGERPGLELADYEIDTDYVLLVNRAGLERISEVWPVAVNEALPVIPIPLAPPDAPVPLDLNEVIQAVYAGSGYAWQISYQLPLPPPALRPVVAEWVTALLAGQSGPRD
jgi:hypothetical protein